MILQADALHIPLADESVQCVVTSPPYWGLRDYGLEATAWPSGWKGCLGLEPTLELYVEHIVSIFREVRRVLKKDGTVFLNLGDSYFGGGRGGGGSFSSERPGWHAIPYGTFDKAPEDYRGHGCLCESLCGVCREVYLSHRFHKDDLLVSMLIASLSSPNHGNKEFGFFHPPTLDFSLLENHILVATQGLEHFPPLSGEQPSASQMSMPDESSQQLLDECLRRGNSSVCLLCVRSLVGNVQGFSHKSDDYLERASHRGGSVSHDGRPNSRTQHKDKACEYCSDILDSSTNIKPQCSANLKPKDLVGIPWMVAFALRDDGWWLRCDIIWAKPNPMPESVRDRPTRAHEYLFLLTKSARYHYDAEAISERSIGQNEHDSTGPGYNVPGQTKQHGNRRPKVDKQRGHSRRHAGFNDRWDQMTKSEQGALGRNKRSVWTIATESYPGAHYATFPKKLVEPCILAGCPLSDTVLDPFCGKGTVVEVAYGLGRVGIGIDLATDLAAKETAALQIGMPI